MNVFDIIILIILILAFISGFTKGFFAMLASLIAVLLGAYAAIHYSYIVEGYLHETILKWSDQTFKIAAFVLVFLVVVLLVIFIGKILTKLADIAQLSLVNKIVGGIFSVLKWTLILSVFFAFFYKVNKFFPLVDKETLETSKLYEPIKKIAPALFPAIIKTDKDGETKFKLPK